MRKHHQIILIILLPILSGLFGFCLSWYLHRNLTNKLQPDVQTIQTFHYPALFVKQLQGDSNAGIKIFKEFCATCHAKQPLIDINAPRMGDKNTWRLRHKLGMPILLKVTIQGVGAMPARGGCFECSDEQLRATIQYILSQSE